MKGTSTRPGKNDSGKASEGYSYYAERGKMAYKIVFDEKILSSLKIPVLLTKKLRRIHYE